MAHRGYREASRVNWGRDGSESLSLEQINTGALLRIADATELMAKRHTELMTQRDMYERWHDEEAQKRRLAERRISSLKGQITKLKKKARAA